MINKKSLFNNRFRVVVFIALILTLGFIGWRTLAKKAQQPQYQTAKVEKGTLISSVSASGQIVVSGQSTVVTQASGIVKNVFVKNRDKVVAGQNLIEIDLDQQGKQRQTQVWASYLSAKNSLDSSNQQMYSLQSDMLSKWKTYMDLAQTSTYQNPDGSSKTEQRQLPQFYAVLDDWLAAEARYKNQQNVISQAQANVASSWTNYQATSPFITAPVAGTVGDITLTSGMTLNSQTNSTSGSAASQKAAAIRSETEPIAQLNLSEIDVLKVKEGQKATIAIDTFPDKTFTGKVMGVDRTGSVTSGVTNYPVTIKFDSKNDEMLPNMSTTANIIINVKDNVLLVPVSSVQTQNGESFVRVIKNGKIEQVSVETGLTSSTQVEIVSGLSEGDQVVTSINTFAGTGQQQGAQTQSPFGGMGGSFRMGR